MDLSLSRRSLLGGLSASMIAAGAAARAGAAPARRFFASRGLPIGLQLYTLGDEIAGDLDAAFARLVGMGYRDFELPQLYGKSPAELRAAADRAGLRFSSIHLAAMQGLPASVLSMLSEPQRIIDDLGVLGIKDAVLPIVPFPTGTRPREGEDFLSAIARVLGEGGEDLWKRTAAMLNEKARLLRPSGIRVGYHNHNVEFAPIGKTTGWEILVRETDPRLVHFEVDIGWVAAAGLDPVRFLDGLHGRARWMHVKDLKAETQANFALKMVPSEVGAGKQDWARILPAAHRAGVRHFYVEQEAPFAMPRMQAAARSLDYLTQLRA